MEEGENQSNSIHTVEELAGRIVKLEELNEKQRRQKIGLAAAVIGLAVGIGMGNYIFKTDIDKHNEAIRANTETTIETQDAQNQTATDEYVDITYYVYQIEEMENGNWVKKNTLVCDKDNLPISNENVRYVVLAVVNEDNLDSTLVFRKKQRSELIEHGEVTGYTEWTTTNDYFVGYLNDVPTDNATELYVLQGTVQDIYQESTSLNEGGISK